MKFEEVKSFITDKLQKELPRYLSYHSLEHIQDVYSAAEMLADMESISAEERTLLLTAVLFHDSGFLINQKDHERTSCEIAEEHLPEYGYTKEQIGKIKGMIMATKLPQTPHTLPEEIICDADLDYLGRDDFFKIGNGLYSELSMYGMIHNEDEWNKLQIRFLESHHYFTKSSISLRQEKKDSHLAQIKAMIKSS
jgi:predicted metal-dependent HD superfamily phosphohydrolase